MNYKKAKSLIQQDTKDMNLAQLQKYSASLSDAWRYARGDYGYNNDFFCYLPELKSYTPRDKWLLKNLETRLDEVTRRLYV